MNPIKEAAKLVLLEPLFNIFVLLAALWPWEGNVAFAVVALTLLVRLGLTPFSRATIKNQQAMHKLQPELTRLKEEHKDDQAKLAQETMALYRRHGINPASGCLPALAQLPILIILFYLFQHIYRHDLLYSFLLSRYPTEEALRTALDTTIWGVDLTQPDLWALPLITGALQFFQSWQMLPPKSNMKTHEGVDMQQQLFRQMMFIFPIMTVFIARSLPAALPLSWSITTLFMIIQQWWFARSHQLSTAAPAVEVVVRKATKEK
jgi:YidC/Oxa1 family membrane protein insertase